jgi:outer membrane protein assembly factor BamB
MTSRLLCATLVASFVAVLGVRADNWPQWRGPTNDGICTEKNLPAEWSTSKNVVWKLDMPGVGSSTPAIWGKKIFLTTAAGDDVVVLCVSTDGKELWRKKVGQVVRTNGEGNLATPSPSTDGKNVWVYFGTGDLACYDIDGDEKWHFNVQDRYGKFKIQWGIHNSPLLHEDRLYVELLHANTNTVVALEKATGNEVWKITRDSDGRAECKEAYTSPVIWSDGKESLLIIHGNDYTTAHRLKDGSEVWRLGDLNPKESYNGTLRLVATPVVTPDLIVVPTAKHGPVVGIKPGGKGLIKEGSEFEAWRMKHGTPDVPSPLIHDGLVYLCGEDGRLTCLDAKSGKEQYSTPAHGGVHRGSPVYADGKIYVTAKDGEIRVIKAGTKFELLATNKMEDTIMASPAIADGRIYLRTFKTLYAISNDGK